MNRKYLVLGCVLLAATFTVGCQTKEQTPLERAGERGDEIVDNVKEGRNPLHKKGTLEKAGEAVGDATNPNK